MPDIILLSINVVCIYPTSPHEQDVTQGHFFLQILRDLNSEFLSLKSVAIPRPKYLVCPTILSLRRGGRIFPFIPFRVQMKCIQLRPGLELGSPCPFLPIITITPRVPSISIVLLNVSL